MFTSAPDSPRIQRWLHGVGWVLLGAGLIFAARDPALGWFPAMAVIGGAIGAAALIGFSRRSHHPPLTVPDPFTDDPQRGMFNLSRARVAGVGGLGLVVATAGMAFYVPQLKIGLMLGILGGFLVALALIPYRRRHAGRRS